MKTTPVEMGFNGLTREEAGTSVCLNSIVGLDTILTLDGTGLTDRDQAEQEKTE